MAGGPPLRSKGPATGRIAAAGRVRSLAHYSLKVSRWVLLIGVLALVATACNRATNTTTTARAPATTTTLGGEATPADAVARWVDTLALGSYQEADMVVDEAQVVLLIAVESYSPEVFDQLARDGVDASMSSSFWESFVAGFEGFTGAAITDVVVGGEHRFEADGREFAEVELLSPRGDAMVVAVKDEGRWFVDVLATFGPSFSSLFNLWMERLPPEATAPRDALGLQLTSLSVARDRLDPDLSPESYGELERLLEVLEG